MVMSTTPSTHSSCLGRLTASTLLLSDVGAADRTTAPKEPPAVRGADTAGKLFRATGCEGGMVSNPVWHATEAVCGGGSGDVPVSVRDRGEASRMGMGGEGGLSALRGLAGMRWSTLAEVSDLSGVGVVRGGVVVSRLAPETSCPLKRAVWAGRLRGDGRPQSSSHGDCSTGTFPADDDVMVLIDTALTSARFGRFWLLALGVAHGWPSSDWSDGRTALASAEEHSMGLPSRHRVARGSPRRGERRASCVAAARQFSAASRCSSSGQPCTPSKEVRRLLRMMRDFKRGRTTPSSEVMRFPDTSSFVRRGKASRRSSFASALCRRESDASLGCEALICSISRSSITSSTISPLPHLPHPPMKYRD
eukprot:Sspe_Gene.58415::Locus_32030_Transcript_1_1_Confidence_1.000_Length_1475::g.58415::m.58415